MSTAAKRSLYGKLSGDSTLNNLLATPPSGYAKSIYYQQAPQGAPFPYVILSKASGTPTYAFATQPAFEENRWLIKGVDRNTTTDRAEAIAERLDALLTDGTISISGATQLYLRRESDVDYPEVTDGVTYAHAGHIFRLVYEP